MTRKRTLLILGLLWTGIVTAAVAQSPRFTIDDDEYIEHVTTACAKLKQEHQLKTVDSFRGQVHKKACRLKLATPSRQKLSPPDLYDRLRESTLAVGMYYKCPECALWHFSSSAGFVVGNGGIICTCCHVVLAEDKEVKEKYLVAANARGEVFPVQSVIAADTESDTCFLKVDAPAALKPLALRSGIRAGERIYCLSHPGGYHFMFTEGMVARLNRRRNDILDADGKTTGRFTRPVLFLNVTAEFAPGSSGGPIVDEAGNVVAQVASITDAGEPEPGDQDAPASPSVPVRFCTAAEEILALGKAEK